MASAISPHKKMAMGKQPFAKGGNVRPQVGSMGTGVLKTGIPESPLEKSKRANGIPGFKKGGKAC